MKLKNGKTGRKARCGMNGNRILKTVAVTAVVACVLAFSADPALAEHGRDGSWRGGSSFSRPSYGGSFTRQSPTWGSGSYSRQVTPWNQGGSFSGRSGFGTGWDRGRGFDRPVIVAPPRVVHRPPVVVVPPRHDCHGPVILERPGVHRPSWPSIGLNIVINLLR